MNRIENDWDSSKQSEVRSFHCGPSSQNTNERKGLKKKHENGYVKEKNTNTYIHMYKYAHPWTHKHKHIQIHISHIHIIYYSSQIVLFDIVLDIIFQ